jgi:uncharacterized protein
MNNPVGWFEIYVDDMQRAKAFYQKVLNISLEQLADPTEGHADMWSFGSNFEQYGTSGALVKMPEFKAGGNSTLVYFSCEDCAVEEARVEAAGGMIQQSKTSIGDYGFCTLAVDSEGNLFGLHSQK